MWMFVAIPFLLGLSAGLVVGKRWALWLPVPFYVIYLATSAPGALIYDAFIFGIPLLASLLGTVSGILLRATFRSARQATV